MEKNILETIIISKIHIVCTVNNIKKKYPVKFRYQDSKLSFFAGELPTNFVKPKKKIPAEIVVYTPNGVYKSDTVLMDCNMTFNEMLYTVKTCTRWDFIQLRRSTRKMTELPLTLKFNDGFEIKTTSYDLSLGGISFFSSTKISSIYTKISGILTIEMPKEVSYEYPDGKIVVEAKYVRALEEINGHFGETLYMWKFMNLPAELEENLKYFLIKLN